MKIKVINRALGILPSLMDGEEFKAMDDALMMYNPLTGPITDVKLCFPMSTDTKMYAGASEHYSFDAINLSGVSGIIPAGGKGATLTHVFMGTVGEAVERFLSILRAEELKSEIIYATPKEMKKKGYNIIGPEELHLFADVQYTQRFLFKRFTDDSYVGWIEGKNVLTNECVYAPAQLVILGYRPIKGEDYICYSSSGGLAASTSKEDALYHGFCELIERDALNIRWVCNIPPKEIIFENDELHELLPEFPFDNPFMKLRVFDWTLDIPDVHVVTIHCVNTSLKLLGYYPGGGADLSFSDALRKAFGEVGQANVLSTILAKFGIPAWMNVPSDVEHSKIDNLYKVLLYYSYDSNLKKVEAFYSKAEKVYSSTIEFKRIKGDRYRRLLKVLKKNGLTPIYFDLTPDEFTKFRLIKTFIPEITMYFIVYGYYGHPRYYYICKKLGLTDKELTYNDLRKDPLPFP
jgi:ribosomal protein S12 methylthiotransferase accessory factor